MEVKIADDWKRLLNAQFEEPYFHQLVAFLKQEYTTTTCFPPGKAIFKAFDCCKFDDLKVVILGQDPYHGVGQANGLCFSVADGIPKPPSLLNIFKEIELDLGIPIPASGNLERWALQGVLLLNTVLTVRENQAASHQKKGWEQFTDAVIQLVSQQKDKVVFILWGRPANEKQVLIDASKHLILSSVHPSPLSASRGFFNNHHFSKTNAWLAQNNLKQIQW